MKQKILETLLLYDKGFFCKVYNMSGVQQFSAMFCLLYFQDFLTFNAVFFFLN